MNELTKQVIAWLREIEEDTVANFLESCIIDNAYVDTTFSLTNDDMTDIYRVTVYVPPKIYIKLTDYSKNISIIEDAIKNNALADNVFVTEINWKPKTITEEEYEQNSIGSKITNLLNNESYVRKKITVMNEHISNSPHIAIGFAKELIETCCKEILRKYNKTIDDGWNILRLIKETNSVINFQLSGNLQNEHIVTIKIILSGISNIIHGIAELRNSFGSGHGHFSDFKEIDIIYSKLAVSSATNLIYFYLEIVKNDKLNSQ